MNVPTNLLLVTASVLITGGAITAGADTPNKCDRYFRDILENDRAYSDLNGKVRAWEQKGAECGKSGLYEFRLANLYTQLRQYEKAQAILRKALKERLPHERELLLGLADIELAKHDWGAAEKGYREVIRRFPDWSVGYQKLGTVKLEQQDPRQAVHWLNQSVQREQNGRAYVELTIAHHLLGNHDEAVQAINRAFGLDRSVVRDVDAMLSAAISYAHLGKFKVSRNLLAMLTQARPDARTTPGYQQAVQFLRRKMQEAGVTEDDLK